MCVVYLLQASASVSNEWRPIFQRKKEKERYTKIESRRERERGTLLRTKSTYGWKLILLRNNLAPALDPDPDPVPHSNP
ncbi:hypothetical protein EVAR_62581_1 [Eumeta japonica]|uniref:Uncharacterized protein n=1 Tax=Eumeta variegata TaxID=151549 RepID=A0A4C1Y763_EUMVA|nr:hypothetical protein EVAR_62581_1 [Eumeta japonica]